MIVSPWSRDFLFCFFVVVAVVVVVIVVIVVVVVSWFPGFPCPHIVGRCAPGQH